MNKRTAGECLKFARDNKQWKQSNLGRATGISQPRLSLIENDERPPSPEEWSKLREHLDLPRLDLGSLDPLPLASRRWRLTPPRLPCGGERPFLARLYTAKKTFGDIVDQLIRTIEARKDADQCAAFLHRANQDSGNESVFLMQLLAVGGKPCQMAPVRAGYRKFGIVEHDSKRQVGDLRRPCLDLELLTSQCLVFPQVTVDARKAYYRLDVLACVVMGRERYWINIEVDGSGHDPLFDEERTRLLKMPTIRLNAAEVASADMVTILMRKIDENFPQSKVS